MDPIELIPTKNLHAAEEEEVAEVYEDPMAPIDETISRMKHQISELRSYVYILAVSVAALAGGMVALARR